MRASSEEFKRAEILLVALVFIFVNALSFLYQKRISLNFGKGWDGVDYYNMAEQFLHGELPRAESPFVYDMGTSFLASLIPMSNLLDAFMVVNILANSLTVFFFYLFLKNYIYSQRIRIFLLSLFVMQWHGPVRAVYFYPAYSDPLFFTFLMFGIVLVEKLKSSFSFGCVLFLSILVLIGVMVRESVLLVSLALPFIKNPLDTGFFSWIGIRKLISSLNPVLFFPLIGGIFGFTAARCLAIDTGGYSFLMWAHIWLHEKKITGLILAFFIAFGPLVALIFYDIKECLYFLMRQQHLLVICVAAFLLSWIGGSDTERILYWSMPVIYVLIGRSIERHKDLLRSLPIMLLIVITQAISQRVLWVIPDYPNEFQRKIPFLTPIGDEFPMLDLFSYHGDHIVSLISLSQYILLTVCIILLLRYRAVTIRNAG